MTFTEEMEQRMRERLSKGENQADELYKRYLKKLSDTRKNPSKEVRTRGLLDIITPKIK